MGWSESREGEKKCARRTGICGGLRLGVLSVKEEDIGVGNQLRKHDKGSEIQEW